MVNFIIWIYDYFISYKTAKKNEIADQREGRRKAGHEEFRPDDVYLVNLEYHERNALEWGWPGLLYLDYIHNFDEGESGWWNLIILCLRGDDGLMLVLSSATETSYCFLFLEGPSNSKDKPRTLDAGATFSKNLSFWKRFDLTCIYLIYYWDSYK